MYDGRTYQVGGMLYREYEHLVEKIGDRVLDQFRTLTQKGQPMIVEADGQVHVLKALGRVIVREAKGQQVEIDGVSAYRLMLNSAIEGFVASATENAHRA